MAQCECQQNCEHHKGSKCPMDALAIPSEVLVKNDYVEGDPLSLRACEKCMPNQPKISRIPDSGGLL